MPQYIFVYGTLRKREGNEFALYLRKKSKYVGLGRIAAKLNDLGGYPGLVLSENSADIVHGDIYEIENDEIFLELDRYEQAWPLIIESPEYVRKELLIDYDEHLLKCWVYVYNV